VTTTSHKMNFELLLDPCNWCPNHGINACRFDVMVFEWLGRYGNTDKTALERNCTWQKYFPGQAKCKQDLVLNGTCRIILGAKILYTYPEYQQRVLFVVG